MSGAASVVADSLEVRLGRRAVLDDLRLTLRRGGVTSLVGPNGAGKTTLLRAVATLLPPTSGAVFVDGLDTTDAAGRTAIRRRLGYLPQRHRFGPRVRVFDVVDYVAVLKEIEPGRPRARRAEVARVLAEVDLADRLGDRYGRLSAGMQQRVALAQALLGRPALLVLDEPAPSLDPEQRQRLQAVIAEHARSATVVQATHLVDEAAAVTDEFVVLVDGAVRFRGTPDELAARAGRADATANDGYLAVVADRS